MTVPSDPVFRRANMLKASTAFFTSDPICASAWKRNSYQTDFLKISYLEFVLNFVVTFWFCLKCDKEKTLRMFMMSLWIFFKIETLFGRLSWGQSCNCDRLSFLQGTFSGWRNCIFRNQVLIEQLGKQKVLAHLFTALFILTNSGYCSVFLGYFHFIGQRCW
jgi:hypothetical protein